jgi:hypothetical protein
MGLPRSVSYHAYDINSDTVDLVNHYFTLEGLAAFAEHRDVLLSPPFSGCTDPSGNVALLLKMYHCLERRRGGSAIRLLEATGARWLVVSFPTRSLASHRVNILANYEETILSVCRGKGWSCRKLELPSEAFLLIEKKHG